MSRKSFDGGIVRTSTKQAVGFGSARFKVASPRSLICGTGGNGRARKVALDRSPSPPPPPPTAGSEDAAPDDKVVHVTSFSDPRQEMDKLHGLYDSLMDARRDAGESVVPFHKFANLVTEQVSQLRAGGNPEVAFRVAVKDGQVSLTARGLKGMSEPYRVYRRAFSLRGWSHVTTESVFPRSTRASGAAGPRARG